jgi:hypothetical protein
VARAVHAVECTLTCSTIAGGGKPNDDKRDQRAEPSEAKQSSPSPASRERVPRNARRVRVGEAPSLSGRCLDRPLAVDRESVRNPHPPIAYAWIPPSPAVRERGCAVLRPDGQPAAISSRFSIVMPSCMTSDHSVAHSARSELSVLKRSRRYPMVFFHDRPVASD